MLRFILPLILLISPTSILASEVEVETTTDLYSSAQHASTQNVPILLMFSAAHCPYCDILENEILIPMLISGDYTDRVLIRKILLDEHDDVRNFNGNTTSVDQISAHYDVFVTPTMLFLGPDGRELAPRIVGVNTLEMFGGRVDEAIDRSHITLRQSGFVAPLAQLD